MPNRHKYREILCVVARRLDTERNEDGTMKMATGGTHDWWDEEGRTMREFKALVGALTGVPWCKMAIATTTAEERTGTAIASRFTGPGRNDPGVIVLEHWSFPTGFCRVYNGPGHQLIETGQ